MKTNVPTVFQQLSLGRCVLTGFLFLLPMFTAIGLEMNDIHPQYPLFVFLSWMICWAGVSAFEVKKPEILGLIHNGLILVGLSWAFLHHGDTEKPIVQLNNIHLGQFYDTETLEAMDSEGINVLDNETSIIKSTFVLIEDNSSTPTHTYIYQNDTDGVTKVSMIYHSLTSASSSAVVKTIKNELISKYGGLTSMTDDFLTHNGNTLDVFIRSGEVYVEITSPAHDPIDYDRTTVVLDNVKARTQNAL